METEKIRALLTAADLGSFSKAADALGYTQSGITHMMNALEEELGVPLLVRGNRGVRLSSDGERLEPQLRRLVSEAERLEQELALTRGVESGLVRIGAFSSISLRCLPPILEQFEARYPGIDIELYEGDARELASMLASGRIDIAFMTPAGGQGFRNIKIRDDPMFAVLPKGHPRAGDWVFPISALRGERFLVCHGLYGPDDELGRALMAEGMGKKPRFSSNFDQNIISLVEHNLGVTVMPALVLEGRDYNVAALPLSPAVSRALVMALRAEGGVSPALKRFIACAKEGLGL